MTSYTVGAYSEPPPGYEALARSAGTFYHDPAWVTGLSRSFGFAAYYVAAESDDGLHGALPVAVVPGLLGPRRLVSLPFSYAAGPIVRSPEVVPLLYSTARDRARAWRIRRVEVKSVGSTGDAPPGFVRTSHYSSYRVSMRGGIDEVWTRLHESSTRRGIKKARRENVLVEKVYDAAGWRVMADLQSATSHRLGLPAPPARFFTETARGLQARGIAELYVARMPSGEAAAAIVCWKGRREWIYAFGASRRELLEHRPVHALLWAAMNDAASSGVDFDLGRAAPEQTGLVQFKRRWGGEPVPLAYDYWPDAGGLNVQRRDRGGIAALNRIWSAMPAALARRGSFLYRYLG